MRTCVKPVLSLLAVVTIALGLPIGSAAASDGAVTLRIPLKLTRMIAGGVIVHCSVSGFSGGRSSERIPIENGELDTIVEVRFEKPDFDVEGERTYSCFFNLFEPPVAGGWGIGTPPIQAPPGPDLWKRARQDEFFRQKVSGQLGPVAVGGMPQGLQQGQPQPPPPPPMQPGALKK